MRKAKDNSNIALRVAVILLVLSVLAVCFMPGGLYARYISESSGGDEARVAKFSVSSVLHDGADKETISVSLRPGESYSCEIRVTNESEVSVKCDISVKNETENLPLVLAVDKQGATGGGATLSDEYSPVVGDGDETAIVAETYVYILTISWPVEDDLDAAGEYQGMVDNISVLVHCEQIN